MNGKDPAPAPRAAGEKSSRQPRWYARLLHWVDRRTGADKVLRESLDEPIPGGARLAYVFGSALLFILASQIVTGVCLALYYTPTPMTAHVSVAYIVKQVAGGAFLRSLHSYGSSAMVVVLILHVLQTLLNGSYKGRRELLWMSGAVLGLLVLAMAFTGYLLSWDQKAFYAGSVGTDIVGQVPVIGERLRLLLRGGTTMGALTLSRFYVLHILIIPALIFGLIATHIVLFRKAGAAGPVNEDPLEPVLAPERFYPKQVLLDMGFVLLVMGVLGTLAHFLPVSLGQEANPADSQYLPRPEWYFVPVFQWLKYWEGPRTVIGVVVIPVIVIGLFFLLPFMDRGRERRPWRRPIPVGGVLIVLIGLIWLGMTSVLKDSRDPAVAAQLAQQQRDEQLYFHAPFTPYAAPSAAAGAALAPLDSTAAAPASPGGKGLAATTAGSQTFRSLGCVSCHGAGGVGTQKAPALTDVGKRLSATQLTSLLRTPNGNMKAGGMPPVTVRGGELTSLVAYVRGLSTGGHAPARAAAAAPVVQAGATSAAAPSAAASAAAPPVQSSPQATTSAAPAGTAGAAADPSAHRGATVFSTSGCASCHGSGATGTSRAPALTGLGKTMSPAALTSLLHHPNGKMQAGGMPAVKLGDADMGALVAYLHGLGAAAAPGASPAGGSPMAAHEVSGNASPPPMSGLESRGQAVFRAHGCANCHGTNGASGTAAAPALAGTGASLTAVQLTTLLQHPTAQMRRGGMPPVSLDNEALQALVAYVRFISASYK